jgi:O-antigen ligase
MSQPVRSAAGHDFKYAPGAGARVPPSDRPIRPLEWVVLAHVGSLFLGTTWAFGGGAEWVRPIIAWWGSLGGFLTLAAMADREAWRDGALRPLWWALPLVGFNALVLVSCLNPSLREVRFGSELMFALSGGAPGWPSTARPDEALRGLWRFDAIWISCFNLALVLRQRRAIRLLLFAATANALVLAVFGTVQKLSGAKGLYFDAVPSPQVFFFSTFIYHNHWGAFVVLIAAVCLGLVWHYARRHEARDFFHSPAFGGLVAVLILTVTVPLSNSRSCTALIGLLLGAAFVHWTVRLIRRRRLQRESAVLPLLGAVAAVLVALGGVWFVARESITARAAKTFEQLEEMRARGTIGSRAVLYRDTLRMARDKPWFGWGMESYPRIFLHYNSQESRVDKLPIYYRDAHSDWLQGFAEHGVVGMALIGLLGLLPLRSLRARHLGSPVPAYLLTGCGLILLYAWVEFPFGNVAVVLTWWLCFFSAVHYLRLQDREAPAPVKLVRSDSPLSA